MISEPAALAATLRLCLLASGSSGNLAVAQGAGATVLIDAGLSARQVKQRLAAVGVELDAVDGVLVTHEHFDHVSALTVLLKRRPLPLYMTHGTARALFGAQPPEWVHSFSPGERFRVGEINVTSVPTSHDAAQPCGYALAWGEMRAAVVTDTGVPTEAVRAAVWEAQVLALESNHDPALLAAGSYPARLKRRILSDQGHLSNDQAARLVRETAPPNLQALALAHLSKENNRPALAVERMRAELADWRPNLPVFAALRAAATPWMEARPGAMDPAAAPAPPAREQLSLLPAAAPARRPR